MKSSKYISILCVGSLLSLASCTDGFESDNKINGSFDDTVKEYDFQKYTTNFETIQKGIYFNYDWGEGTTWPWQTFQNLNHDMFSGYFHDFASNLKFSFCYLSKKNIFIINPKKNSVVGFICIFFVFI